ncbi:ImmA/IrrE family metallo-endopeptidase [Maribacter sp. 2210JD10-5]|uniref:ImmA/IrrE family metallo-endopeptidase n=1 Tax=Maribacter sp. 2210JD10-5 TaxID=3386272 RepID=UPI0039BD5BDB
MTVEHNISRLKHLLNLYKISVEDFLDLISNDLKNKIKTSDIFSESIKINHLKRIDKVFKKGLHYYLDPKEPETSKDASIFFRKEKFNSDLNIGAKKVVNHFEEFKISLSAIAQLADLDLQRSFPVYKITHDPKVVAQTIRKQLYPSFTGNLKEFLKALISKFAEKNILVFEFVEYWNQKEKANIDGFFLNPNVIVLKRQQISFRREIFTLAHELGHFLLNEEEIEKLEIQNLANENLSSVEKWCNDFAFHFLAGEFSTVLDNIDKADSSNDYHHELIEKISKATHLSQIAIFTRLLFQNKITKRDYSNIKEGFESAFRERQKELEKQKALDKERGIEKRGSAPKPIKSPLLISTIQTAFYEGILNEYEVCKRLNIKPEKLDSYIQ